MGMGVVVAISKSHIGHSGVITMMDAPDYEAQREYVKLFVYGVWL